MISSRFTFSKKPMSGRFFVWLHGSAVPRLIFSTLLLQSLVVSANVSEEKAVLTLASAVERTLRQHPQLGVFEHRYEGYQGLVDEVGVGTRPYISLQIEDFSGSESHRNFESAQATLSISWVIQQAKIESRIRAAKSFSGQIEFQKEIVALDLSAKTARLFIQALVQEQRLVLAAQATKQARKSVGDLSKRAAAGKGSEFERLQADVALARRELDEEDLEHAMKGTRYQLGAQWGEGTERLNLKGDLFKLPDIGSVEHQFERLKKNPTLTLLATQQRIAESEIELARIEAKPQWQFSVGVRRYQATDDVGFVAGVSVPLGNDAGHTGKIRSLRAKQAEYDSESLAFKRKVETQIYVLLQEMAHSQHVIERYQRLIIPTLVRAQVYATKAYEKGRIPYQQWSDIVQKNLDARHILLGAFEKIHLQHIELQRLTGASLTL
jgi:outer membrane protein, heavy metal efflux system